MRRSFRRIISSIVLDHNGCVQRVFGIGIVQRKVSTGCRSGVDRHEQLESSRDSDDFRPMPSYVQHFGFRLVGTISGKRLGQNFFRRGASSTVIGRQLIQVGNFRQSLFTGGSATDDFNLGGRTRVEPSLDDAPSGREKRRRVDNEHFRHGFGETNRIDRGLFLDNRQCLSRKLGRGQFIQIQDTHAFETFELRILCLLCPQTIRIVMHHDVPMKLDDSIECRDLFHPIHV
mmetsp:Transcript_1767/g.3879  ORF Transcript_1767/g.3879 Transcript_1767/m.3879 type:complete len:231 (+) Transcript_1767:238-930(+)